MSNTKEKQTISVLGSTGSVGEQALDVADKFGLRVSSVSANTNSKRVEEQARKFSLSSVAMADESAAADLRVRLADTDVKVYAGESGICEMVASEKQDTVVNSIIGEAGLLPTLAVIDSGAGILGRRGRDSYGTRQGARSRDTSGRQRAFRYLSVLEIG